MIRRLSFCFFLAWGYLKPSINAPTLINILSVLGVMLGVGLLIIVIAVMTGFTDEFKTKLLNTMAHIQIHDHRNGLIEEPDVLIKQVENLGFKASPIVQRNILIQYKDKFLPKFLIGFDKNSIEKVLPLSQFIRYGSMKPENGQLLISDIIAQELGVWIGDKIIVHSPVKLMKMAKYDKEKGLIAVKDKVYLPSEFEICGIYSFDKYDFDSVVVFSNLEDANELFEMPWGSANLVYVTIPNPLKPESAKFLLEKALDKRYGVRTWKEINSLFLEVLAVEKTMMYFLLIFIVVVAAFSISVSLITFVMKKIKEIGLLKAMGASDWMVVTVFTLKGFFIGLLGTIAGTLFGICAVAWRNELMYALRRFTGIEIFPRKFYFFSQLPATIKIEDLLVIWILSMCLCIIGALLPSLGVVWIQPAKALKHE